MLNTQMIYDSSATAIDSLQVISLALKDTCAVTVTGTTLVSIRDLPKENQPNGWIQLLLPIFITFLVVFVEKWITRYYDHKDKKEERRHFRNTVLDWIVKVVPIEKKFSHSVHKLAENIKASDDMQPIAYAMPLTLHDKMKDMSVEKMSDAFLRDFSKTDEKFYAHMYNIISNFEFLSKISDSIKESYDSYNKQSFALCQQWNGLFERFRVKCNRLSNNSPYNKAITMWFTQLIDTPNSVSTNLRALDSLCLLAFNERDFEMLSLVTKMRDVARQSQATSKGFEVVFSNIACNIDLSLESLLESEQFFRNLNPIINIRERISALFTQMKNYFKSDSSRSSSRMK